MKIAHVITRMIVGGAQENTLFSCEDLIREHGAEVVLFTGPALGPEGDLFQQRRTQPSQPLQRNAADGQADHGAGQGGAELSGHSVSPPSSQGAPQVPLIMIDSLRRAIHPWRDAVAYRALRRELKKFAPDVVHTHSAKGGFLGRLAAWSLRAPAIVHTVHGAPFHPYQSTAVRNLYRWLEWHAAGRCHQLVSVADAMTDLMVGGRVAPREKFVTVYSGMEVEPFLQADQHRAAARAELGLDENDIVVGKIARLFHLKGHEYLIEAARLAAARSPRLKFLLVGDGLLREDLERQIRSAGLEERFRFTGLAPPAEIPKWLGAMDVLVHTSLREGLARALPQALIAGRPAVSYDIDGAREVVLDRVTGRLLPPRAVEPLADAFVELAERPDLREQWGREGRRRFTDQFRRETMARELYMIYEKLLQQRPR